MAQQEMAQGLPRTMALVEEGLAAGVHIGAQVYVSLRGRAVVDTATGLARPAPGEAAMTPETLMVWLSAGKPLTAVAIGRLVDAGRLSFDDPVVKHIPEFAPHGKDAITIRHLLTHTAGLRTIHTDWPRAGWEETMATLCGAAMEKDWPPGAKAGYHAFTSWYVLGEIVRRVDGRPIETYLRSEVFAPLGMNESSLTLSREEYAELQPRMGDLQRIIAVGGGAKPRMESMNLDTFAAAHNPRPAGGVRGPIRELGMFYEAMLRALKGDGSVPTALAQSTARMMTSRARPTMFDETFKATVEWGLGFQLNSEKVTPNAPYNFGPHASPATFGHGGFQASVGMGDPEKELVVAAIFNGCPGEAKHLGRIRRFFTVLYEELGLA